MSILRFQLGLICISVIASAGHAQRSSCRDWGDAAGDAVVRRTDHGNDGLVPLGATLPDMVRAEICAWEAYDPEADPYAGDESDPDEAHLFRLDLVFAGLVNPPGSLGFNGDPRVPFRYGPSPVVGFVDLDLDDRKDTGGELGGAAEVRYLANVGRFGRLPGDSLGERAAKSRAAIDGNFDSDPQYERSGGDFALVLCGCFEPTIIELDGDGDETFEPGERWLAMGRFFERAQGYRDASAAYGGSAPGLYDPVVELLFSHDPGADETTITLVWALDPIGAAALAGEPVQPLDLDVSNHASIVEALQDIIDGADGGGIEGPAWELVRHWQGDSAWDHTDVSDWGGVTGLVGMPYAQAEPTFYVWTDTLGEETPGDVNGSGYATNVDKQLIRSEVYLLDGGSSDADATLNGRFVIKDPGWDFSVYDTNGDMVIDLYDQEVFGPLGDFNESGVVDTQDFIAFLNSWADKVLAADFNLDQKVDIQDFIAFLNAWVEG